MIKSSRYENLLHNLIKGDQTNQTRAKAVSFFISHRLLSLKWESAGVWIGLTCVKTLQKPWWLYLTRDKINVPLTSSLKYVSIPKVLVDSISAIQNFLDLSSVPLYSLTIRFPLCFFYRSTFRLLNLLWGWFKNLIWALVELVDCASIDWNFLSYWACLVQISFE